MSRLTEVSIAGYRPSSDKVFIADPIMDALRPAPGTGDALNALRSAPETPNCKDREDEFIDNVAPDADAEAMCAGCPLLQLCRTYGELANPPVGIWGGKNYEEETE